MKKLTKTFNAISDDGQKFTIYEFTKYLNAGSFENPNKTIEGTKELRTSDNEAVNRLEKGKYEILNPFGNIKVTSNDPNAP